MQYTNKPKQNNEQVNVPILLYLVQKFKYTQKVLIIFLFNDPNNF